MKDQYKCTEYSIMGYIDRINRHVKRKEVKEKIEKKAFRQNVKSRREKRRDL